MAPNQPERRPIIFGVYSVSYNMVASARQLPLFPPEVERSFNQLPAIGEQSDIRYFATRARSILNPPATTGMDFWSINPYTGCAFGCTYCYARYAHRYVMERNKSSERLDD